MGVRRIALVTLCCGLLVVAVRPALAANVTVTGTLLDVNGRPVPTHNVAYRPAGAPTADVVQTDPEGHFTITVASGTQLGFSVSFPDGTYIAYSPTTIRASSLPLLIEEHADPNVQQTHIKTSPWTNY